MAAAPGPVHIDVEFRDPLGPDGGVWPEVPDAEQSLLDRTRARLRGVGLPARSLPSVDRGLVIAGDGAGDVARLVAEAHGWPLLAEPTSGSRSGANGIGPYVALLTSDAGAALAARTQQVVVIGRPTLSRPVGRLIDSASALFVANHGARWREAPRHAERVLARVPEEWLTRADGPLGLDGEATTARASRARGENDYADAAVSWLDEWLLATAELGADPLGWTTMGIASAVVGSLHTGDLALIGSSGPIRAVDRVAPVWEVGELPVLVANRGLSGIDGTVSTATGVALASRRPVTCLMGDVTFLHDAGGLLIGPLERKPDLRIVVVNDGGGTIFSGLEHASAAPQLVERVFTTPHGADIAALCAGYGVAHRAVTTLAQLRAALAKPISGTSVIEAAV